MAVDQELSALTAVASLLPTDIIYLVRDPGGALEADHKAAVSLLDTRYLEAADVGSAAYAAVADFATAAQGGLAATALQNAAAFATSAQGLLAASALQAAAIGVTIAALTANTFTDNQTAPRLRLTATGEATLSSTLHAFQIGPDNGPNIIIDQDEIQARNNEASSQLNLNPSGGIVSVGGTLNATSLLRALATAATTLAGSPQGFQVGTTAVANLAFDPTTIQARNNGAAATLNFNPLGGALAVGATGASVGFLGATPQARPAITGSRGGNAALADLLTKLASFGLITDSTSA